MAKSIRTLLLFMVLISSLVFGPVMPVQALSFDAEINKSFTPAAIISGGISKLRVTIYNPNSFQLTQTAWTDNFPAGITISSPLTVNNTCGGSVGAVVGGATLSLSNGTVPQQVGATPGECYVEVDVTSTTSGNLINTIGVGLVNGLSAKGNDGGTIVDITNSTPASATLNVIGVTPPTLSKSFAPNTIYVGGNSVLTIDIRNNDASATLTEVTFTDNFLLPPTPTNIILATPVLAAPLSNCGTGTVTGNPGDTALTLNNAQIAAGATCRIQVNVTSAVQGAYTNTIPAGPGGPGSIHTRQGVTNGLPATANLNVQAFTLTKTFFPASVPAGSTSTLTIGIRNRANIPYTNVGLYDDLYPYVGNNLEFIPATATFALCGAMSAAVTNTGLPSTVNNRATFSGGTIAAGDTCTITISVRAFQSTPAALYANTIPAGRITTTQLATNDVLVTTNLTVTGLTIGKNIVAASIPNGGTTQLIITITNPSTLPYTVTTLTDNLSAPTNSRLSVAAIPGASATCVGGAVTAVPAATSVTLTGGTVPASGSCTITVNVTGTVVGGPYTNTIPIGVLTTVEGGTNAAAATDTISITGVVPTLGKAFSGASGANNIQAGGTATLTLTITNPAGAVALTGLGLVDNLATTGTGLLFTSLTSNTCTGAGVPGAVAGAGTQLITLSGYTLAAGPNTCTIVVVVTIPLNTNGGTVTNTITQASFTDDQGIGIAGNVTRNLVVRAVDLASKTFTPSTFQSGGTSRLVITLQNYTGTALTVNTLTDNLGAPTNSNLSIAAYPPAPAPSTICGSPGLFSYTAVAGTQLITVNSGITIPPGTFAAPGTCTVTFPVTGTLVGGPYTNTIPIGNLTTVEGPTSRTARTATVTIYATGAGVTLTKTYGTNPVNAGSNSLMTLTISAPADATLTNFSITDPFPTNMVVGNPTGASVVSGCGAAAFSPAVVAGATSITVSGGTITPGTNCIIRVNVTGNIGGAYVNRIQPVNITNTQARSIPVDVTQTLNVNTVSTLVVTKNFQPTTVNVNGLSTLTIYLENSNLSTLINAGLTDNLPGTAADGLVIAPTPNASTTCTPYTSLNAVAGTQQIRLIGGTIPARVGATNGLCSIKVDIQGKRTAAALPAPYPNNIPVINVTATNQDTLEVMNSTAVASATLTISTLTMEVVKKFDPTLVYGGSASQLSITLRNPNPSAALTGIAFTDIMPPDPLFPADQTKGMIIATPANFNVGTCGGTLTGTLRTRTFTYSGGMLPAASECVLTLNATMTVNGNLTNTIPIGAVTTFNGVSNTTATSASLTNLAGASVSKAFSPGVIAAGPGDVSTLTITIRNTTSLVLTGMGLVDTLPLGLTIAAYPPATAPSTNCGPTLDVVAGTRHIELVNTGTLAGNASCTIVVPVTSSIPGTYTNTIPKDTLTTNEGASNHEPATDILTVTGYSLGNRVWDDNGMGVGGVANDGLRNGTEPGLDGVTVNLYRASAPGTVLKTTTTGSKGADAGYYRFDDLVPDTYIVEVVTPAGYTSSLVDASNPDNDIDNDDNGVVVAATTVRSNPVTLGPGANEPTGDKDPVTNPEAGEAPNDQSNRTVDFAFTANYSLGNFVWADTGVGGGTANDGLRNGTEPGLSSVTVDLYRDHNDDGTPDGASIANATTDSNGYYRFDNLLTDTYIVEVVTPAGYTASTVNGGDPDNNIDTDNNGVVVAATTVRSNPVMLGPGGSEPTTDNDPATNPETGEAANDHSNRTVDFSFYYPPYSLGNRVWNDNGGGSGVANDGLRNGTEPGLDGVTVNLYRDHDDKGVPDGGIIASTTTASKGADAGYYRFDNLMADTYIVEVVTPAGYTTSAVNGGDSDNNIDDDNNSVIIAATTVRSNPVTLGPGGSEPTADNDPATNPEAGEAVNNQSNRTVDFGFFQPAALGNFVWNDLNVNGVQDVGESGINGVTVNLYRPGYGPDSIPGNGDDANVVTTQLTAGGGAYNFTGLTPGNYYVEVIKPGGYTFSPQDQGGDDAVDSDANTTTGVMATTTLVSGENDLTWDAGLYQSAALGNFVWNDLNANGIQEAGENGIPEVTVNLLNAAGTTVLATTTTNVNGLYSFTGLTPGTYGVEFVAPAGYTISPANQGADDAVDSDANIGTGRTGNYTLVSGETNNTVDAGLNQPTALLGLTKSAAEGSFVAAGDVLNYTYVVTNIGNVVLTNVVVTDDKIANAATDINCGGTGSNVIASLGMGAANAVTCIASYTVTAADVTAGFVTNVATADSDTPAISVTATLTVPGLFDPPTGIKVFDDSGLPLLRWTMTWINSTNLFAVRARVSDPIPAGTTYSDTYAGTGSWPGGVPLPLPSTIVGVSCTTPPLSVTTTDSCYYEGPSVTYPLGRVVWEGTLGPDDGHNDAASAVNELYITFNVTVPSDVRTAYNVATVDTDRNGDGTYIASEERLASIQALWALREPGGERDRGGARAKQLPVTGFAPGVVTILPKLPADKAYFDTGSIWLEIPRLGVRASIEGIPQADDGTWDVSWLWQQAGWLQGTAYPTGKGNSAITGHVYLPNGKPGPFVDVNKLAYGNKIIVHAYGQKYTYEVRENKQVRPNDVSVLKHEDKAWLTLLTCLGYDESNNTYASRVAIRAVLMTVTKDTTSTPNKDR